MYYIAASAIPNKAEGVELTLKDGNELGIIDFQPLEVSIADILTFLAAIFAVLYSKFTSKRDRRVSSFDTNVVPKLYEHIQLLKKINNKLLTIEATSQNRRTLLIERFISNTFDWDAAVDENYQDACGSLSTWLTQYLPHEKFADVSSTDLLSQNLGIIHALGTNPDLVAVENALAAVKIELGRLIKEGESLLACIERRNSKLFRWRPNKLS